MLPPSLTLASYLLILTVISSLAHIIQPKIPLWISGLNTWLALFLILIQTPLKPFKQFFALTLTGLLLMLIGMGRGESLDFQAFVIQNNGLIVLLYGVSFLRLIALANPKPPPELPIGKQAFLQTLFGVHILGAVINMSILVLMAERLQQQQALSKTAVTVLTRGFSMAAYWSPFFAAMSVALTYAPNANLPTVVIYGLGLMIIAMLLTIAELGGWQLRKVKDFQGYPLHLNNLMIPSFLAIAVFVLHYLWPQVPVIAIVSITAIIMGMLYAFWGNPKKAKTLILNHIQQSPLRMARELSLFMGAGILSLGVQLFFASLHQWQPLTNFGAGQASLLLGLAILVSILGVHPIVSIAVIGTLAQPLHPNPTVLAIVCLSIWSLGVVASPFSGVNTVLGSQFQVEAWDLIKGNIGYVFIMWVVVSVLFLWMM